MSWALRHKNIWLIMGAILFVISDFTLGFHLFVHPLHHSVLRIMIPYYAGQLFLFWGGQKLLRNTRQGRDEAVCR